MAPTRSRRSLNPATARRLHALCHLSKEQRKAVLKAADTQLVKGICECVLNTLKGVINLSHDQKKKLQKHKAVLRKLVNKKSGSTWQSKKKLIVQKGEGFLAALLPIISSVVASFIPSIVK